MRYILFCQKLIRQYGSITVIGLGMLMGGFVVTLGLQTWRDHLPIDGGIFRAVRYCRSRDDFCLYCLS